MTDLSLIMARGKVLDRLPALDCKVNLRALASFMRRKLIPFRELSTGRDWHD
jgi:hypothetical protein